MIWFERPVVRATAADNPKPAMLAGFDRTSPGLPPIASGHLPCGEEVAGHLAYLFDRFGPPLFCKRDNGSNLNHSTVDDVLEDAWVIPINSPPNTPAYNGAIERTQREFNAFLKHWQWKAKSKDAVFILAENAAHELNHVPRRCLNHHPPAEPILEATVSVTPKAREKPPTYGSGIWQWKFQSGWVSPKPQTWNGELLPNGGS